MNLRHSENTARQSFWMVHIEAWRRSGLTRTEYCRQHRLTKGTFDRWLTYLAGKESARKHVEYRAELRQRKRREEREKRGRNAPDCVTLRALINAVEAFGRSGRCTSKR